MAAGLRDGGFHGEIAVIGAEHVAPYERPHLSKGYLAGTFSRSDLALRPAVQYRELDVDLELGRRVVALGLEDHRIMLEDGKTWGWDLLCIATGSDSRRLPGARGLYLRELADAERLKQIIDFEPTVRIVGAGFIGCEVAAVARGRGRNVRVDEALAQPLLRVLGPELGAYLAEVHRDHGVDLHLNSAEASDATLIAVGSAPRTSMAETAGIDVRGGILVDPLGRTSVTDVYAAGDVTRFLSPAFETHIRVEHFQSAQRQGFAVGRSMAGAPTPYDEVPWFWSDQYDLNLQYVGAGLAWDEIAVRGRFGEPPFALFYLAGGQLIGAAGVNDHHTVARARRVMEAREPVTRAQLEDPEFDLRAALR